MIPTRHRIAILGLLGLALAPSLMASDAAAQSRCSVQISDLNRIEPQDGYDPFAGSATPQYHRFTVRHQNGPGCSIAVTMSQGDHGDRRMERGGDLLDYELFKDASLTTPVSGVDGSPGGWLTAFVGVDGSVDFEFFSVIPPGQMVGAGRYDDRLEAEVWLLEGGLPGRRLTGRQPQVRTDVVETVQTSVTIDGSERPLVGGTVGTLDFGTLESGARRSFQLSVQGNIDYAVTLESENRGQMSGPAGTIPYTLSLDGQSVGLGSGTTLPYTNTRARTHAVVVSVGDIGRALAGSYQDNLLLTVTAR